MTNIFIDPGHGGDDQGVSGHGLVEKNLVLNISLRLRRILQEEYQGVNVRLSRTSDTFVPLDQRAQMAVDWGADGFVSVHLNAGSTGANGCETYMHTNSNLPGLRDNLHEEILSQLRARGTVTDRGVKSANFAVLRGTYQVMRTALTESLFLTHSRDAALLQQVGTHEAIARGHANGLEKEFNLRREEDEYVDLSQAEFQSNREAITEVVRRYGVSDMEQRLVEGTLNKADFYGALAKAAMASGSDRSEPSPVHEESWGKAEESGVMNGERPGGYLTREQLASVLDRTGNLD